MPPAHLWGSALTLAARAPATAFTALLGMVFNVLAVVGIALAATAIVLPALCYLEHLCARHGGSSRRAHAPDA